MHFIAYVLAYPFIWLISVLPFRPLYMVSDLLYILLYKLLAYRKKTVLENLYLVFPDKSEKEIREITSKFYRHFCDMMLESIKTMTISENSLKKRFTFSNIEVVKELEAKNRSVALMAAHYGSWEWMLALQYQLDYDGYAIYKRLHNKYFDRLVKRIRARHNSYLITTKETLGVIRATEKAGKLAIYGFAADQSPKPNKAFHWNNFMGIKVPMYTGAETIAKKFDLAIVYFSVKRLKRGFYEASFQVITEDPKNFPDYQITDKYFGLVETQIKQAPEYYLWTHKRWKHRDKVPKKFQ